MKSGLLKTTFQSLLIIIFFGFLFLLIARGNRINYYLYLIELNSIKRNGIELVGHIVGEGNMKGDYKVVSYTYKNKSRSFKTWHFEKDTKTGDSVPVLLDTTDLNNVMIVLAEANDIEQ